MLPVTVDCGVPVDRFHAPCHRRYADHVAAPARGRARDQSLTGRCRFFRDHDGRMDFSAQGRRRRAPQIRSSGQAGSRAIPDSGVGPRHARVDRPSACQSIGGPCCPQANHSISQRCAGRQLAPDDSDIHPDRQLPFLQPFGFQRLTNGAARLKPSKWPLRIDATVRR